MGVFDWLTGKRTDVSAEDGDRVIADTSPQRRREQEVRLAELDQAFRQEPGNVKVLAALGKLALELGDLEKAQRAFRAMLLQRLEPSSHTSSASESSSMHNPFRSQAETPMSKADVFFALGEIHHRLGERAKAINMLERAVDVDPRHGSAQALLRELQK